MRRAPESLADNSRPPSPGLGPNINSPFEKILDWFGQTTNPEYVLILSIYIIAIINIIFLLYIIINYVFRNWISPKIEAKIKSKWLLWFINYNKKVSLGFLYFSFFMLLLNNLSIIFSSFVLIYFTNLFNTPSL